MAESAVSFVLNQLATLMQEEQQLVGGLHEKFVCIKGELEFMRAFLGVADANEDRDPELKVWVNQVREVAFDAEDVLDLYMLRFAHLRADEFIGCVKKMCIAIKKYGARHNLASNLRNIEIRVKYISEGHHRYQSKYGEQQGFSSSRTGTWFDSRGDALHVEEAKLVGLDQPKKQLIEQLVDGRSQLKVVSVVGMGGAGKSTLAKRVYEDEQVNREFHSHAWINVSQVFNIEELLKDLLWQLHDEIKEPMPHQVASLKLNGDMLKEFVKGFLFARRYIIVFDDIWNIDSWDALKNALPNTDSKSRVLVTTRIHEVAYATCTEYSGYVYEMKPLSSQESWTLFCNKAFQEKICPTHLENVSRRILTKCQGLPLAIVAIGGLLALKDKNRMEEWEMVHSSLGNELDGDGKLGRVKQVLLLSYHDLPYYLRGCLLYMSLFPEDHMMEQARVIRLWTAEGLVQGKQGLTKEEVAQGYLSEFVNRSLIQVAKTTFDGRLNLCRMHDIVREIIISKSREQNIASTVNEGDSRLPDKVRRFAIHSSFNHTLEMNSFKYLRSLVLTGYTDSISETFMNKLFASGSRLLKVLDVGGAPLQNIPNEIFKLYALKHLSLRWTGVKVVPKSIGKLLCLETLDLKHTNVIDLPIEILKLQRLRYLSAYKYLQPQYTNEGFKCPHRIGSLTSLQKLCYIQADQMDDTTIVREIGRLTQLRRLGISKLKRENGKDLFSSLQKLTNLRSLNVASSEDDEIIDLQYAFSSTPRFLRTLYLKGRLEKVPQWIPSLCGLTKVILMLSKLTDDPLESLQDLPNLAYLKLDDNFEGQALQFRAEKFPSLRKLRILRFRRLTSVVVEKDSMPNLDDLCMGECKLMVELPIGLEHLTKLQMFVILDMDQNFVDTLENDKISEGDCRKLAHVPQIVVSDVVGGIRRWLYL